LVELVKEARPVKEVKEVRHLGAELVKEARRLGWIE
jgi:hypothetical protein